MRTHVLKVTYGNFCHIPFEPGAADHQSRVRNTFVSVSGSKRIRDAFNVILPKVSWIVRLCLVMKLIVY